MNIEHIAQTLGLKKYGNEYKGPCPICGGDDRFHVKKGQRTDLIFLCRHGCRFSDIMRHLEESGLVPKTEYLRPQYLQSDLDHCDALIMVCKGNMEKSFEFHASDMLALSRMVSKVDPNRQKQLHELMDRMRGCLNE
jgi:hypothetical protein